ncbi:hypothetical protein [Halobacillus massiliensis]|uniref:hypothetical protein n=1 Tax=Halobacillus massiliensis TaxID=1926286 RepID=UPI0015C429F2|nr:hypothetical protein [Halobacillus massiliensis]
MQLNEEDYKNQSKINEKMTSSSHSKTSQVKKQEEKTQSEKMRYDHADDIYK